MNAIRQAGLISAAFLLCACAAPRWENLRNPAAEFQADNAACEREAERVVKMEQLARPNAFANACIGCPSQGSREMQDAVNAYGTQKRCMAARGWRQAS